MAFVCYRICFQQRPIAGQLQKAIKSIFRRQKHVTQGAIAERHKTVRTFLTNFEKIFFMLAQHYQASVSSFLRGGETATCYQFESICHLKII